MLPFSSLRDGGPTCSNQCIYASSYMTHCMVSRCGDHLHHFVQELEVNHVKNSASTGAVISFQPNATFSWYEVGLLCLLFVATKIGLF